MDIIKKQQDYTTAKCLAEELFAGGELYRFSLNLLHNGDKNSLLAAWKQAQLAVPELNQAPKFSEGHLQWQNLPSAFFLCDSIQESEQHIAALQKFGSALVALPKHTTSNNQLACLLSVNLASITWSNLQRVIALICAQRDDKVSKSVEEPYPNLNSARFFQQFAAAKSSLIEALKKASWELPFLQYRKQAPQFCHTPTFLSTTYNFSAEKQGLPTSRAYTLFMSALEATLVRVSGNQSTAIAVAHDCLLLMALNGSVFANTHAAFWQHSIELLDKQTGLPAGNVQDFQSLEQNFQPSKPAIVPLIIRFFEAKHGLLSCKIPITSKITSDLEISVCFDSNNAPSLHIDLAYSQNILDCSAKAFLQELMLQLAFFEDLASKSHTSQEKIPESSPPFATQGLDKKNAAEFLVMPKVTEIRNKNRLVTKICG